ncbi:Sialic acid O-acyltransferase, NeuD [Candidatus Magnetobacterium bavaricum]|uniref:Sialic acid O-acyltransferase, NeuD n=1 Tax=Candidatus Magnetobacterium bavaricum TaxID=29290 RepID=A0A0F3GHK8_9BACT|nr:Sialic acid O-acyltransferase, NeuD [Candidatus Magnetobacterium bavaricum]
MQKIVIIGGGGHAKVLIDIIFTSKNYEILGIIDSQVNESSEVCGIPVIGNDGMLQGLYAKGVKNVGIGVGSVRDNNKRKNLYIKVKQTGFFTPTLIHPRSIVSTRTQISDGVQIMAGVIIGSDSFIGNNTIINTGAIIEHDCIINSHVHICSGAVISGGCKIEEGAFIGAGSIMIQGLKIGVNAVVAAGAVVIKDVPANSQVAGVPAKIMNK